MADAFSLLSTSTGLLFAPLAGDESGVYGFVAYVRLSGVDDLPLSRICMINGERWIKAFGLSTTEYVRLLDRHVAVVRPVLGNLARITGETTSIGARDRHVLATHHSTVRDLSDALGVAEESIGFSGSALYSREPNARELDFVVFGREESLAAFERITKLIDRDKLYVSNGKTYHWRFKLRPDAPWLDPHFHEPEPWTLALGRGDYESEDLEEIADCCVGDATNGIFFPSRYGLSDGSILLSYRLGHSGLLRAGDVIRGPAVPTVRISGRRYRLLLGNEQLEIRPNAGHKSSLNRSTHRPIDGSMLTSRGRT